MSVRVTGDTNVFYYLGAGSLRVDQVIGADEQLVATPINVLEILAGISAARTEWNARRDAARAVANMSHMMAADPEEHLAAMIERRAPRPATVWLEAAKALAGATDEGELNEGVKDYTEQVVRSVSTPVAEAAKGTHYANFKADVVAVCDSLVPGYAASVASGTAAPVVAKPKRAELRAYLASVEFVAAVFFAGLVGRYQLFGTKPVDLTSDDTFVALRDLAPYCAVYGRYLSDLLTARRKPAENDWGDLELFMYLQPDTYVATAEQKWWKLADEAGVGPRVRRVTPQQRDRPF